MKGDCPRKTSFAEVDQAGQQRPLISLDMKSRLELVVEMEVN